MNIGRSATNGLLAILILLGNGLLAQVTFQRTLGGVDQDRGSSMVKTFDSCFVFTGSTKSNGAGDHDLLLVKVNGYGDTLWTRYWGGTEYDTGTAIVQTTDGGFAICGSTRSYGQGDFDVFILRTDGEGNLLTTTVVGGTGPDSGESIIQTSDGGLLVGGSTAVLGAGEFDMYLIKLDVNGAVQWSRTYGTVDREYGYSVVENNDNTYLFTGNIERNPPAWDEFDILIIKIDLTGAPIWERVYSTPSQINSTIDRAFTSVSTPDGGVMICGGSNIIGGVHADVYLIKLDASGVMEWSMAYGTADDEFGSDIELTADGGCVIVGKKFSSTKGVLILKVDALGTLIWRKAYGGPFDSGYAVVQAWDGGFAILGATYNFGNDVPFGDIYLIRTDDQGGSGCFEGNLAMTSVDANTQLLSSPSILSSQAGVVTLPTMPIGQGIGFTALCSAISIPEIATTGAFEVFPNPTTSGATIELPSQRESGTLVILDPMGKMVYEKQMIAFRGTQIRIDGLSPNMNIVRLYSKNKVFSKKLIVL